MVYLNCRLVISLFFMDDHDDVLEKINNLYQQFHILNEAMGTNFKDISDLNISLKKQRKFINNFDDAIKIINNKIENMDETNNKLIQGHDDLRNYMIIFILSLTIFVLIIAK